LTDTVAKYYPDSLPRPEPTPRAEDLRLLSVNEAREILKVRHETVKKLIKEGRIEVIMIGKRIKIPMRSLETFIKESSIKLSIEWEEPPDLDSRDYINNKINLIIKKHTRGINGNNI